MGRLFGTDGIRGIANQELTCELAASVGRAVAAVLKNESQKRLNIVVGCDPRRSSDMLCSATVAGICSAGANAYIVGCLPTPAVAYFTKLYSANAGIMVSASHNSSEYNGIKVFSSEGVKLSDRLEDEIEAMITDGYPLPVPIGSQVGKAVYFTEECIEKYVDYLKSTVGHSLNGLNIAIDCSNGASYRTAYRVFSELGASVHTLSATPDGDNINENCGSTHLDSLIGYVKDYRLDAGFAFDGDADRCMCVDENGNIVDGDMIMAMCALDMKKRGFLKNNTVVGTVMTNLGFTRFCSENGINFIPTKVGDRFVLEEMLGGCYSLGGEQSGHIIFGNISKAGDGQLTALQVLSLMKRSGKPLSELASAMTVYPQITVNIKADTDAKRRFYTEPAVNGIIRNASSRLSSDGRLIVRPSGTEPLIRITAEGRDSVSIREIAESVASQLQKTLGIN